MPSVVRRSTRITRSKPYERPTSKVGRKGKAEAGKLRRRCSDDSDSMDSTSSPLLESEDSGSEYEEPEDSEDSEEYEGPEEYEEPKIRTPLSPVSPPPTPKANASDFPSRDAYKKVEHQYLTGLVERKQEKALISQAIYDDIFATLSSPKNITIRTAQFRWWVRKNFSLAFLEGEEVVVHQGKPVAVKEQLYDVLVHCHDQVEHGGRDKTCAQVNAYYSWIPKDLVARFVAVCPECLERRNPAVPRRRAHKPAQTPVEDRPLFDWSNDKASKKVQSVKHLGHGVPQNSRPSESSFGTDPNKPFAFYSIYTSVGAKRHGSDKFSLDDVPPAPGGFSRAPIPARSREPSERHVPVDFSDDADSSESESEKAPRSPQVPFDDLQTPIGFSGDASPFEPTERSIVPTFMKRRASTGGLRIIVTSPSDECIAPPLLTSLSQGAQPLDPKSTFDPKMYLGLEAAPVKLAISTNTSRLDYSVDLDEISPASTESSSGSYSSGFSSVRRPMHMPSTTTSAAASPPTSVDQDDVAATSPHMMPAVYYEYDAPVHSPGDYDSGSSMDLDTDEEFSD